jgi:regulator of protease activity HflC (stomatin/prohibitin superfamily)
MVKSNEIKHTKKVNDNTLKIIFSTIGYVILGVLILTLVFGSWYIVNAGERGILVTLGKPSEVPTTEGIHFKVPVTQSVVKVNIQTQKYETTASSASSDLQTVKTDIAVNYHLATDSVVTIYKEIGLDYANRIIQPAVQEVVKASTAHYTAEQLITQRSLVKDEIDASLAERLGKKGIILETTSITNFDFSDQFNQAIEKKVTAEQDALTQKNRLAQVEYEAQQLVAQANGKRDAAIAEAEGQAKSTLLNANAEAQKVQLVNDQLKQSKDYVEYIKAQRWDGKLPTTMFGQATPLVQFNPGTNEK